jgi:hypothetical protein
MSAAFVIAEVAAATAFGTQQLDSFANHFHLGSFLSFGFP